MKKLIYFIVILCALSSYSIADMNPYIAGISSEEIEAFDFCVRADGTATKANATGPVTSASGCMNLTTLNASSFSAGEKVLFTSRGGNFTTTLAIPSAGTSGNNILYKGEDGHQPDWTSFYVQVRKSYVTITNMRVSSGATSSFEFGDATNTYVGIETNNLDVYNGGNQAFQHLDGVTVVHNDIYAAGADDEGVSLHNDDGGVADPIVTINGATIVDCYNGFNWVGAPTLSVYDFTISGLNALGKSIDGSTASGGTYIFERGTVTENVDQNSRVIDCYAGSWTFKNVIFLNLTDADFYMLGRSGVSVFDVINCTFLGDGVNTTTAIFNQYTSFKSKNNIFDDVGTEGLWGATGTIAYNCFYNSGTARGTNTVTSDPALSTTGFLTGSSTAVDNEGIGPGSDADIPTDDIEGDTRSGSTCSMGADEI